MDGGMDSTYERYETGRKGLELKTSDSMNRCSRSHDIAGGVKSSTNRRG